MKAFPEASPARPVSSSGPTWQELFDLVLAALRQHRAIPSQDHGDFAQHVFLVLARRRSAEPPEQLRGLAVTIANRTALSQLRNRHRPANSRREQWRQHFAETRPAPPVKEFERDIEEAQQLMADDTRAVFRAIVFEGWTQQEAAKRLGRSRAVVRRLFAEAIDFLERLWGSGEDENYLRKPTK